MNEEAHDWRFRMTKDFSSAIEQCAIRFIIVKDRLL